MKKLAFSLLFMCICTFSFAQNYTVDAIRKQFKSGKYTDKVLEEFHQSLAHLEEKPDLYEYLPGEIIGWSFMDGRFLLHSLFRIEKNTLHKIDALPKDETFLSKLNSFVPEKSRFIYREELWTLPWVKEKLPNQAYLIQVNVKSYHPRSFEPNPDILTYTLEYSTIDFKTFQLMRLKEAKTEKWIEADK